MGLVRRWRATERAELALGALSATVLLLIAGMIAFVLVNAWPSFSHNGLSWFGSGGDVNSELVDIFNSPGGRHVYTLHAWPLLFGTLLTTVFAVGLGLVFSVLTAVFIVEFAPPSVSRVLRPVVRLLAAVPSVIYGLVALLALSPWINDHLVSQSFKLQVNNIVPIGGNGLLLATVVLTVMVTPIMIAIIVDALAAVPRSWTEGSAALGVNRWRTMWRISVRTARPAIAAGVVLAAARALGEAIMLAMVSGSFGFSPNPLDGLHFFVEPVQPLAATIVANAEGLSSKPFAQTIYAFAAVLLFSSAALSLGGHLARRQVRRYGTR